jgi:hypothetical protein
MKRIPCAKYFPVFALVMLLFFTISPQAIASGLFGAPQTVSKETGGLNTAIGYRYHEDTYENGANIKIRLNEIYSQAAYGKKNIWEVYGRVGMSDLKIEDFFKDNENFFGTLGAKAYYPMNNTLGIGAFVQGTYYFSEFTDTVSRNKKVELNNLWDVNFGIGFQAILPRGLKLYAGPYIYYSEAKMSLSSKISGLGYAAGDFSVSNKSITGGFAGVDIPLAKGFRLNMEGQYSDRFSAGAVISYTY